MTITAQPVAVTSGDYAAIINVTAITSPIDTASLFNVGMPAEKRSAIEQFLANSNVLNKLFMDSTNQSQELASIVFLGYMSAIESYIRALIRSVIHVDKLSLKAAESRVITFGAALHHTKELMPEALMDEFSFICMDNIKETFRSLLALDLSMDERTAREFDNICQLRHCCVHRFGRLGAKNAMKLGLDNHSSLFERKLNLNSDQLLDIASRLRTIAKSINNSVYRAVMDRTYPVPKNNKEGKEQKKQELRPLWTGLYEDDKVLFGKYYTVFASRSEKSPKVKEMYDRFISEKQKAIRGVTTTSTSANGGTSQTTNGTQPSA